MPKHESFAAARSPTAASTLAEVVARLASSEGVVGAVALGSTADDHHEDSDIDLLVVLDEGPELGVEFEYVDGRPADVLFTGIETLATIRDSAAQGLTDRTNDLRRWLANGSVLFSKHDVVDDACAQAASRKQPPTDDQRYFRWVDLNVTYVKLTRYASSARSDYRPALDFLLDAAFAAAPTDALVLAGTPWPGERQAFA